MAKANDKTPGGSTYACRTYTYWKQYMFNVIINVHIMS